MKENSFKMLTIFIICLCIFAPIDSVEEKVDHGSEKYDAKLILNLIKRIRDPNYNYQSEDQEMPISNSNVNDNSPSDKQSESASNELQNLQTACEPVIQQGSIIKTKESISAGAVYIDSLKNVKLNTDCLGYCCQNSTCDVAVYQDKGDRYCYLFRCAGRCIFRPHTGYLVSTITGRKSPEHPEEDLQSLNSEVIGSNTGEKSIHADASLGVPEKQDIVPIVLEQTTVKMTTTTQTEAPELIITPHSVGLGGFCTQNGQCEDPNAVCGRGNCVCKDAFYNKEGICRKVCLSSQYECFELGTLVRGPECVLQSQVCDSYLHCADGSDEFNCENTAHNYQQTNWSHQSGSDLSSSKVNTKNSNLVDPYTQPVMQEPVSDIKQNTIPQPANPQVSTQNHLTTKENEVGSHQQANMSPAQNYDVRLKPTISSKDGSMYLNQNHYSSNVQPHPPRPNPYPNTGNRLPNSEMNAANPPYRNHAKNSMVDHDPNSLSMYMNTAPKQQVDGLKQVKAVKLGSMTNSQFSAPSQTYQSVLHQMSDTRDGGQNLQKHVSHDSAHQKSYSDPGQNNQYSSHFIESQRYPQASKVSNQQSGLRPNSNLHPESSGNNFPQNSQHVDKSLSPSQKPAVLSSSSLKSSKPTNLHSHGSGNTPSKSRSKIQSSSKSHASSYDQSSSKSQNQMSVPSYSNAQKWLDPNMYVPYNLGDSSSQQEQPKAPEGNHYFDSQQYYPPYSNDALDPLPESLLENTGSNDVFSQFGGPDVGRSRSLSLPYNSQNSGYQGYPDSSYGAQYPVPSRYDDIGDYRSPSYQDPDFYSSLGSQRAYRPSAGLYEDFPSGVRPPKSSSLLKGQDTQPSLEGQKHDNAAVSIHRESTQAAKPSSQTTRSPTTKPPQENKTDSSTSPRQPTHKPFPENIGEKKHIFMSSEKVIIANTSDAEGPIIALSLGLAFTLILLVLVGCRLRNVRHRLRKGRPLHQNEADYLINVELDTHSVLAVLLSLIVVALSRDFTFFSSVGALYHYCQLAFLQEDLHLRIQVLL